MIPALEKLKTIPHWIFYKNEIKKEGDKPAKMPKSPHAGFNASSTDSATWGTFMEAVKANKRYNGDGLGWVFTEDAGIVGIDLDNCIDDAGQLLPWARDIVDSLHSYTEISPSGRGVHVFIYGQVAKALGPAPNSAIEIYNRARYFTVTGQMLPGSFDDIATRQEELDKLWQAEKSRRDQERNTGNVKPVSNKLPSTNDHLKAYTEKAMLDEIATLSMATSGCRNDTLNRVSFNLGQFIEAQLLNRTEIETTLLSIAIQLGLDQREAEKTIQSGINGGVANPRANWPEKNGQLPQDNQPVEAPPLPPNDLKYHEAIKPHLPYIESRWGLSPETVNTFKVGYCDTCPTSPYSASFTVPYYENTLVDIRHHLLSPNGQGAYRPEVEGYPPHLFNIGGLNDDWAILVNKEFNTMLLVREYDLPTVGLPSTFKASWLAQLSGLKKVFVALDPDQRDAAHRIGKLLVRRGIDARISTLPYSPRDMLVKYKCSMGDFFRFIEQGWGA